MASSGKTFIFPVPSIRTQLLIIALVVLVLPWLGVQTVRDMEQLLRQQQLNNVQASANTIIQGLEPFADQLMTHQQKLSSTPPNSEIILSSLPRHLRIDGYADDWPESAFRQHYDSSSALISGKQDTHINFDLITGIQGDRLLMLFDVKDDHLYQTRDPIRHPREGDHLTLSLPQDNGLTLSYIITSSSPGWLTIINADNPQIHETRIQAELQSRQGGYVIEIAIPLDLIHGQLSFDLTDWDEDNILNTAVLGNSKQAIHGVIFGRNPELEQRLSDYLQSERQYVVLDARNNILAQTPAINNEPLFHQSTFQAITERLYQLALLAENPVIDDNASPYRLDDDYIHGAQQTGEAGWRVRTLRNAVSVMSLATPMVLNDQTVGVLLVHESTRAISHIRQQAIIDIIKTTLLAISIVIGILLFYASILVRRIRRLNKDMQHSVGDDGRLTEGMRRSCLSDEIGELNRGMVGMVERLQEYQRYMETMASKLSHELRTPLTVVQSSLENLQSAREITQHPVDELAPPDPQREAELLRRANEGLSRLRLILNNLTEASKLENALKMTEVEEFDLVAVVRGCIDGYQQAYANVILEFTSEYETYQLEGSPDLIAQMLDKLISNAVDFHATDTAIKVKLVKNNKSCELQVENEGPAIPDNLKSTLFDSMMSQRLVKGDEPHLGLGLYIVRLIAEFHCAKVNAINIDHGVRFSILLRK